MKRLSSTNRIESSMLARRTLTTKGGSDAQTGLVPGYPDLLSASWSVRGSMLQQLLLLPVFTRELMVRLST
jgi:hypothetical protein